jgi:FkbM family methyltransferase
LLKKIYGYVLKSQGKFKNELIINYKDKELRFSTRSDISKKWFYPRYISGNQVHEPPIAELISENINSSDIFFDIGANLGFFSVLASHFCCQDGEVHSFEMDPNLIPLIEQSIKLNNNSSKVFINCLACTNKSGQLCQFAPQQVDNPSTNRLENVDRSMIDAVFIKNVLSISIDDYCRQTNTYPDLMKVDIEGVEVFAIPGMLETLKKVNLR